MKHIVLMIAQFMLYAQEVHIHTVHGGRNDGVRTKVCWCDRQRGNPAVSCCIINSFTERNFKTKSNYK